MSPQNAELILIVDDTPANLDVISDALSDAGFEVAIATSGDRAFKQLQLQLPNLILLDVMMPEMDGFEVCQRLKANPATQEIPVIFMTALSDTPKKTQGFALGAVDYITKPFEEAEVLSRIKTHLQLHQLTRTLEQQVAQRTAELAQALKHLQSFQLQLVQSEKMSALGNLVAGVAHEINNPVGFVQGNVNHIESYVKDLLYLIDLYQQHCPQVEEIQAKIEAIDLDYLRKDIPKLIGSTQEGIKRIHGISHSLRTFSRDDSGRFVSFDIHDGLDSTLLILKHRLKANSSRPEIEVIKHYDDLPPIECSAGQLNQVFMNILANAIDALDEMSQHHPFEHWQHHPQRITIRTHLSEDQKSVVVRVGDNGPGIPAEIQERIFDHLFTTKEVGKGTGLGLAIAHQIVVEKHGGAIEVNTVVGKGTEFLVKLPLN